MKQTLLFIALFVVLLIPCLAQNTEEDCDKINFHYLIVNEASFNYNSKRVYVFLDEKAFSEENLKNLFTYLSKQYPQTTRLDITVYTNWQQLPLPVDCSPGRNGVSDAVGSQRRFPYYEAHYRRTNEHEYFRYNSLVDTDNFKIIVIK